MTLSLVDAHCHLHDKRLWSNESCLRRQLFEGVLFRAREAHVQYAVSCATHEEDWRALEHLIEQQKYMSILKIIPSFGIHPWWSHRANPDSLEQLRDILMRYPAASVGEIGLCKSVRGRQVPLDVQVEASKAQLRIAAELKRACVLHCVGHYGKLLETLQEVRRAGGYLPPVLVLHSYSGSPDMMRSFLMLQDTRVFASLNAKQLTDPRMKKAAACCKEVPIEALLLETDAPDQAPLAEYAAKVFNDENLTDCGKPLLLSKNSVAINEPCMVNLALQSAAEIRGVGINELAAAVYQNSTLAFGIGTPSTR